MILLYFGDFQVVGASQELLMRFKGKDETRKVNKLLQNTLQLAFRGWKPVISGHGHRFVLRGFDHSNIERHL